jgi:hypothetical protein
MTVTFTLTTSLTDAGPFNISGTTSGGALNGESIATGVTKQQLLTGYTVTNINDTITGGTIASTGTCTTTDTWSVTPPCTCYTVQNINGTRNIIFEYNRCLDGAIAQLGVTVGSSVSVCVAAGGDVYDISGELTITDCGPAATCTVNGDCEDCV